MTTDHTLLQDAANGKGFDQTEVIRAIARKLLALEQTTIGSKEAPAATTEGRKQRAKPAPNAEA